MKQIIKRKYNIQYSRYISYNNQEKWSKEYGYQATLTPQKLIV